MSEQLSDVEQIELSIEEAKEKIALFDALKNLEKNPDFKKLIEKKYLESYPIRLVRLKAAVQMRDPEDQKMIENRIIGVGEFFNFLNAVAQEGHVAMQSLRQSEEELDLAVEEAEAAASENEEA